MNEQKVSGIEWTRYKGRPGYTWNPVVGCSHECKWTMPDGTEIVCYAKAQAEGPRLAKFYPEGFSAHYFHPHRLNEPREAKEPSGIFVSSMGDLFGGQVEMGQIAQVIRVIREYPQHVFFLLTKAPKRMLRYVQDYANTPEAMPRNVLLGASMPADSMNGMVLGDYRKRAWMMTSLLVLRQLRALRGYDTWMSFEPLSWDISKLLAEVPYALSWAVIGAASEGRRYFPPNPAHLERLHQMLACQEVPVFHKGNLREFIEEVREEFPLSPL